jgi:trimeric autotransporter adhesin
MSNKLTRKSLAFGALVALASSAIAGAPAQAAGEVVFAPTTGTSYNTLVTESFALSASLAPGQVAANISQLKYKIDSATASSVVFGINTAAVANLSQLVQQAQHLQLRS